MIKLATPVMKGTCSVAGNTSGQHGVCSGMTKHQPSPFDCGHIHQRSKLSYGKDTISHMIP